MKKCWKHKIHFIKTQDHTSMLEREHELKSPLPACCRFFCAFIAWWYSAYDMKTRATFRVLGSVYCKAKRRNMRTFLSNFHFPFDTSIIFDPKSHVISTCHDYDRITKNLSIIVNCILTKFIPSLEKRLKREAQKLFSLSSSIDRRILLCNNKILRGEANK